MTTEPRDVVIPPLGLRGAFVASAASAGVVVFAHGSGSSRHSSRNRFVAHRAKARRGIGRQVTRVEFSGRDRELEPADERDLSALRIRHALRRIAVTRCARSDGADDVMSAFDNRRVL